MIKALVKDSLIYSAGHFASNILGVVLLPFYTRILSTDGYGTLDYLNVTVFFLYITVSLQITQGLARYYITLKADRNRRALATTGLVYIIVVFGFVAVVVNLLKTEISSILFGSAQYTGAVGFAGLYVFVFSVFLYQQNLLKFRFEAGRFAISAVSQVLLSAGFILYFVGYADMGVTGVFVGHVCSYGLVCILLGFWTRSSYKISNISPAAFKKMVSFGSPLVLAASAFYLLQVTDRYLIEELMGLEALGVYGLGAKISSVLLLLLAGFQLAWGPFIYEHFEKEITPHKIGNVFNHVIAISFLAVLSVSLFAPEILRIFTVENFYGAYIVIPYLTGSAVMSVVGNHFSVGFGIAKKNVVKMWIHLAGAVVNIVLNIWLIKLLGIEGAALATLTSFLLMGGVKIAVSNVYYKVPLSLSRPAFLLAFLVAAIVLFRIFSGLNVSTLIVFCKFAVILVFLLLTFSLRLINIQYLKDLITMQAD